MNIVFTKLCPLINARLNSTIFIFFRNPKHKFRRQKICHQDGGSHQLQLHLLLQEVADEQVDPGPVHRQSRPVHETEEAGPHGRAADEGTSQRRKISKTNRTK